MLHLFSSGGTSGHLRLGFTSKTGDFAVGMGLRLGLDSGKRNAGGI
jgi:hypothetical protein